MEVKKENPEKTSYQWLGNGKKIKNANDQLYTIKTTTLEDFGKGKAPPPQTFAEGEKAKLATAGTFSHEDYDFVEWTTHKNGSGATYSIGVEHNMKPENITPCAQWLAIYTIVRIGNFLDGTVIVILMKQLIIMLVMNFC